MDVKSVTTTYIFFIFILFEMLSSICQKYKLKSSEAPAFLHLSNLLFEKICIMNITFEFAPFAII